MIRVRSIVPALASAVRRLPRASAFALPAVALALLTPAAAHADAPPDVPEVEGRTPGLPPAYLLYEGEGVSVAYHPAARERVRALLPRLESMRDRLRATLGAHVLEQVEIRVAALSAEMAHLSPGDTAARSRVAVFRAQKLVVVTAEESQDGDGLDELVSHGLAHLALGEATRGRRVPGWFDEGFADATSGTEARARLEALAVAALRHEIPSIDGLDRSDPSTSPIERRAVAADLVSWIRERNGGAGAAVFAVTLAEGSSSRAALETAAGSTVDEIERGHRETLGRRFGFAPVLLVAAIAWLVIATISLARRGRRAIGPGREDAPPERTAPVSRDKRTPASPIPARAMRDADGAPVEPGVPKVRRSGGWHTLH